MAENLMNNGTSFQQADIPITCAKGCGFYGTPATLNMCSKCYRDHLREENQATSAKSAVEKSLSPPPPVKLVVSDGEKSKTAACSTAVAAAGESSAAAAPATAKAKAKNRCSSCNKKVGVLGFQCKCGFTYCGAHRYPEEHKCTFDFMEVGKKAIAKANPLIKADKLDRL